MPWLLIRTNKIIYKFVVPKARDSIKYILKNKEKNELNLLSKTDIILENIKLGWDYEN